jgi:hypothetical protein
VHSSSILLDSELFHETQNIPRLGSKPRPDSYDSGRECSLQHLSELYRLVEAEEHELDGYVFDDTCLRVV